MAHSYSHLYEQYISDENIHKSIINGSKNKRKRSSVKLDYEFAISDNPKKVESVIRRFKKKTAYDKFKNAKHIPLEIYDGITRKKRVIIVPKWREQVVHHMICNVLIPIFSKGMYEHTYASIPNRGAHKGKKFIEKWIKHDRKNVKYCLKMDIRHFFQSIDHNILKRKLKELIHDDKFLTVLFEVIDVTEEGLPLGFYTSQWLANWFLQDLDHYIKEKLKVVHYMRYMDDMVIFGSNKRKLHEIRNLINEYLENELHLTMKDNWQIFRFDYIKNGKHYGRDLDFMGFRFFRDKTILRKSIMFNATRKAKRVGKKEKMTIYEIRQVMSYLGYIKCTDTYNMYLKWYKPYVNIQHCKRRLSNYDKNNNPNRKDKKKKRKHRKQGKKK